MPSDSPSGGARARVVVGLVLAVLVAAAAAIPVLTWQLPPVARTLNMGPPRDLAGPRDTLLYGDQVIVQPLGEVPANLSEIDLNVATFRHPHPAPVLARVLAGAVELRRVSVTPSGAIENDERDLLRFRFAPIPGSPPGLVLELSAPTADPGSAVSPYVGAAAAGETPVIDSRVPANFVVPLVLRGGAPAPIAGRLGGSFELAALYRPVSATMVALLLAVAVVLAALLPLAAGLESAED